MFFVQFTLYQSHYPIVSKLTFCISQILSKHTLSCVFIAQLYPTLWDALGCNPPGSSVHGILQERVLEWVAIPYSRGSSQPGIESGSPSLQADSLPYFELPMVFSTYTNFKKQTKSPALQPSNTHIKY